MKNITIRELMKIYDDCYGAIKAGKIDRAKILLLGQEGYGRSSATTHWAWNNAHDCYDAANPGLSCVLTDDCLETISSDESVLILKRINFSCYDNAIESIGQMINAKKYKGYNLDKLNFVVATAFPNDGLNHVVDIPNSFTDQFTVYNVVPSFKETLEYVLERTVSRTEMFKKYQKDKDTALIIRLEERRGEVVKEYLERLGDNDIELTWCLPPCKVEQSLQFSGSVEAFENSMVSDATTLKVFVGKERANEIDEFVSRFKQLID